MENKQFPEQDGQELSPVEMDTQDTLEMQPLERGPQLPEQISDDQIPTEKVLTEATVPVEDVPEAEESSAEGTLDLPVADALPAEDSAGSETIPPVISREEIPVPEAVPRRDGAAFMASIPDVNDDPVPIPEQPMEAVPDQPDTDYQNILNGNGEDSLFDLSILDDPEFAMHLEPEQPDPDVNDQEYRDNGKEATPSPRAADLSDMFQRPPRKGRPKRKKGEGLLGIPNILATGVWLALILAIGVTLGRMLWVCAADVLAFGRPDRPVTITIYESDSMEEIIDKLYAGGLIRYKSLFSLYADISDAEEDIQPGIYDLNTRYDYHALVNFMSPRSSREVVELTIPEGYTCRQIFKLLEENRICTAVDIGAYAATGELDDYWFLEGVARDSEYCLEGYLFPDTYEFYKNSTPREALQKMLNNFDYRVAVEQDLRPQLEALNANLTGNYTMKEIVIVASLIEKESAAPAESPSIAGVIYNRLFKWEYPALLNIDAAIVYAQDGDAEHIDTSLDSPYNTYRNVGLTPTPIANPGLSSLKAALNPASHGYYYYVLNPSTGMHQFSTTQEEHDGWIREFYS